MTLPPPTTGIADLCLTVGPAYQVTHIKSSEFHWAFVTISVLVAFVRASEFDSGPKCGWGLLERLWGPWQCLPPGGRGLSSVPASLVPQTLSSTTSTPRGPSAAILYSGTLGLDDREKSICSPPQHFRKGREDSCTCTHVQACWPTARAQARTVPAAGVAATLSAPTGCKHRGNWHRRAGTTAETRGGRGCVFRAGCGPAEPSACQP